MTHQTHVVEYVTVYQDVGTTKKRRYTVYLVEKFQPKQKHNNQKFFLGEVSSAFYLGYLRHSWKSNTTKKLHFATYEELCTLEKYKTKYKKYTPVGSVSFVQQYASYYGVTLPSLSYAHPDFVHSGEYLRTTLVELLSKNTYPVFVKPVRVKLFSGTVLSSQHELLQVVDWYKLSNTEELYYSTTVKNFSTEWRVYVHRGKLENVSHYLGNPLHAPSVSYLRTLHSVCSSWSNAPVAYTVDVGYNVDNEKWELVELNDYWGTGPLGVSPESYYVYTLQRWNELRLGA